MALSPTGIDSQRNQWSPDHRASLCMLCSGFFATNRPYVRLWPYLSGLGDGLPVRPIASGHPARQRRIDHAGSNCAVAEFGDLRANSRCILGARPAPHQKALSGARHRSVSGVMQGNFADDDFLVACHHGRWIGGFGRRLCRPVALRRHHQRPLSSTRMILLFAAPSLSYSAFGIAGHLVKVSKGM